MATILCVDDDPLIGRTLDISLKRLGHSAVVVTSVGDALRLLQATPPDLIITDYQMPGINGLDFLAILTGDGVDIPLIMLTGFGSIDHAVEAIRKGAADYLTKPFEHEQLDISVQRALQHAALRRENEDMKREVSELRLNSEILGSSEVMEKVLQTTSMAARTRASVLLQGESGTGKELFARAIHDQSDRRDKAFIKLNCAALPEGLIESALFGHEKGAFTGALKRVEGAFERANHGTLLLDEISEMRVDLQAKLLRVLQEQEFERVGGTAPIRVDVRIIATTNRDLAKEAASGAFRQDLYYRLSVLPIRIPPLRDRRADIPLLATRFAMRAAEESGREFRGFAPDAIAALQERDWPGNVRELQHAVERAVILSIEPVISGSVLETLLGAGAPRPRTVTDAQPVRSDDESIVLRSLDVASAEQLLIARALERAGGNRTHAAKLLGISVRTLRSKLNSERLNGLEEVQ
jgi:DNA-binding NtrC family response regulator